MVEVGWLAVLVAVGADADSGVGDTVSIDSARRTGTAAVGVVNDARNNIAHMKNKRLQMFGDAAIPAFGDIGAAANVAPLHTRRWLASKLGSSLIFLFNIYFGIVCLRTTEQRIASQQTEPIVW